MYLVFILSIIKKNLVSVDKFNFLYCVCVTCMAILLMLLRLTGPREAVQWSL